MDLGVILIFFFFSLSLSFVYSWFGMILGLYVQPEPLPWWVWY